MFHSPTGAAPLFLKKLEIYFLDKQSHFNELVLFRCCCLHYLGTECRWLINFLSHKRLKRVQPMTFAVNYLWQRLYTQNYCIGNHSFLFLFTLTFFSNTSSSKFFYNTYRHHVSCLQILGKTVAARKSHIYTIHLTSNWWKMITCLIKMKFQVKTFIIIDYHHYINSFFFLSLSFII